MRTLVYVRVSTREQGDNGYGIEAQRERCSRECESRGWTVAHVVTEVASASPKSKRPELARALRQLEVGQFDALMVSRIDRLSRSLLDFTEMLAAAETQGWALVCLDPAVDMSTPYGRMMAKVAMSFAELERELTSIRTKEGLAVAREQGRLPDKRYGDASVIRRIVRLRRGKGMSLEKIAETLTAAGVPTPGGQAAWNHKTISLILSRETT
jgi:DNA invertase Pin-like site-specific DNA recombinase